MNFSCDYYTVHNNEPITCGKQPTVGYVKSPVSDNILHLCAEHFVKANGTEYETPAPTPEPEPEPEMQEEVMDEAEMLKELKELEDEYEMLEELDAEAEMLEEEVPLVKRPSEYPEDITANQRAMMRNVDAIPEVEDGGIKYPELKRPTRLAKPKDKPKEQPPPAPPKPDPPASDDPEEHITDATYEMVEEMSQLDEDERDMDLVQADSYIQTTMFFGIAAACEKTVTSFGYDIRGYSKKLRKMPYMPRVCKEVMQDILSDGPSGLIDISNPQIKLLMMMIIAGAEQYQENSDKKEIDAIQNRLTILESQVKTTQPVKEDEVEASQMGF